MKTPFLTAARLLIVALAVLLLGAGVWWVLRDAAAPRPAPRTDASPASSPATPDAAQSDAAFGMALGSGDLNQAAEILSRRRAREGATEAVGTMSALLLLSRGQPDAARAAFETVVQDFPDASDAKVNLAKLLTAQGRVDLARPLLAGVLAKAPANLPALATQLQIMIRDNAGPDAMRTIAAAEAAAPADPRIAALHADLLLRLGDAQAAETFLLARRETGPLDPMLLATLARVQVAAGQNDAAIATFAEVLKVQPGNLQARLAQANLLVRANQIDAAEASLKEGIEQAPGQFATMAALVGLRLHAKGLPAALALADELRADPRNMPAASLLRGDLLMAEKQPAPAAEAFAAEFAKAPSTPLVLRLAGAHVAAGQEEAAATVLRGWAGTHPDEPDVQVALAGIDLAARRWDLAQAELESHLRLRPNDGASLNNLAWIYQQKNDPRALDTARRAFQLNPQPTTADTLGWIQLTRGDIPAAIATLNQAYTQAPDNPALAYHFAAALQKGGRGAEAVPILDKLLARTEPFDDRAAAERLLREVKPPG